MRNAIEIRLQIIRSVRETKLQMIDTNINVLSDNGEDVTELRAHRQRLRDITEPYKALLEQDEIEMDNDNPMLAHDWDAFTSVDWN